MKSDLLTDILKTPVPWSPALIEGFSRDWRKKDDGMYVCDLVKKEHGKCLGAVLLISRLNENMLKPLIEDYEKRGYTLKKSKVLIGDITREIMAFLP